ncbi:opioid growth factor receptor-related protein [Microvirga pudoricolor]|uniref:opioid growth factor receptor-related protein n=1 Tax=Microvirga pudoricolor TaxID=2778729 RepID=UPI00194F749D|nr:opioid growth factor receptor-related protein [Microvirga pudoricolor]MBM6596315.1 hypothetical protein [Microvirga pudoricolor]
MNAVHPTGPLHAFLSGTGTDGRGRLVGDVLAFDDHRLEAVHDYIQWLFPLRTRSMAQPGAPVLTQAEAEAIRADPKARTALVHASDMMLGFYACFDGWLTWSDHNHLRISRIIASLRELLGQDAARAFHEAVMERHEAAGRPINPENLRYWHAACGALA